MAPFIVYITQSAHTDIGYTHPQEQIGLMYLEHYDTMLDLCRATESQLEATRFKWTCETGWQVRHYLTHRPERLEEFVYYVKNGQIDLSASYLHFTDLIDLEAIGDSLDWAVEFSQQHGLPLNFAMHCDINGWPWGLADKLAERKIPYFLSQIHLDSATDPLGKRGSGHYGWLTEDWGQKFLRPDMPVRIPQAFYWEGPAGGKVLHWLGEHYLLGNMLGLSGFKPFGGDKTRYFYETDRQTVDELLERAEVFLPQYIDRLKSGGYALDKLMLSTGGFYVDNSPPNGRYLELIARWNATHSDIQLRSATVSEWFAALEAESNVNWPTYRVAWPDHWAHGLGSSATHIAQARRTQRRRPLVQKLVKAGGLHRAQAWLDEAAEFERLAVEHTFSAWCTAFRPKATQVDFQDSIKRSRFHQTEFYLDEAVGSTIRHLTQADPLGAKLYIGASHSDQPQIVHFSMGDEPLDPDVHELITPNGDAYRFQADSVDVPQYVVVLPSSQDAVLTGFLPRKIAGSTAKATEGYTGFGPPLSQSVAESDEADAAPVQLASSGWQLEVNPVTGGLNHLVQRSDQRDWVNPHHTYSFGQLVHEQVVHPRGRAATSNLARFVALDVATDVAREQMGDAPVYDRTTLQLKGIPQVEHGPVYDAVVLGGRSERVGQVRLEWRAYHALPIVELVMDWYKLWNDSAEAVYVAFPFAAEGGQLEFETGGGFFRPGYHGSGGQLPGTCSSYYTIQRAAKISASEQAQLLWLPVDVPLVMPNEINYNRWETGEYDWNGFLASMPVNHYWHTNFSTSQRGHIRLRYRFISPDAFGNTEAAIQAALPVDALGWR